MSTAQANDIRTITPQELAARVERGETVDLIDVRTPAEYREIHATIARCVPLDSLDPRAVADARPDREAPLYVICRSGTRAGKACEKFHAAGITNVINVEGGTLAWADKGLPVVRGKKTISLERQVRIVAGALVFLGSVLGGLVNPWWFLLSGFVGAGLVFAGITDTCGMAMMLARMPWNRVKLEGNSCTR